MSQIQAARFKSTVSTNPTIYNLTLTLANTEYSQALAANTKQITVRCRGTGKLQIAFSAGDTSLNWITIPKGSNYSEQSLDLTGVTLYVQSDTAAQVAEIIQWV